MTNLRWTWARRTTNPSPRTGFQGNDKAGRGNPDRTNVRSSLRQFPSRAALKWDMGELIDLSAVRAARGRRDVPSEALVPEGREGEERPEGAATFWLDVASPFSYLACERVERVHAGLRWRPVLGHLVPGAASWEGSRGAAVRARAERRAEALRMPLVWPERSLSRARAVTRAAAHAAEHDRAAAFVLAAGRLAFCGGFDLDDPEVLAEAAGAAGLVVEECLAAAGDAARDVEIETATRCLAAGGVDALPVLQLGGRLLCGEERLAEAAAKTRLAPGPPARLPHVS